MSEERFRLLVESVKDYAIFMLDPERHVATWNDGASAHQGIHAPTRSSDGTSRFSIRRKTIATASRARELMVASEHGRFEDEGWRVRKDGTQFWANVVITAHAQSARQS